MSIILPRRRLLLGFAASMLAAPAVVRAASLMPIRGEEPYREYTMFYFYRDPAGRSHEREEKFIVQKHDLDMLSPRSKSAGTYSFVNIGHGWPGYHEISESGLVTRADFSLRDRAAKFTRSERA